MKLKQNLLPANLVQIKPISKRKQHAKITWRLYFYSKLNLQDFIARKRCDGEESEGEKIRIQTAAVFKHVSFNPNSKEQARSQMRNQMPFFFFFFFAGPSKTKRWNNELRSKFNPRTNKTTFSQCYGSLRLSAENSQRREGEFVEETGLYPTI